MDKKAKKSEYNRKFRELQKSKIQNETVAPKVKEKVEVKVEVKPSNFFFQTLKNKIIETSIILIIPITLKMIPILVSRISSTVQFQALQPKLQQEENQSLNITHMETNF